MSNGKEELESGLSLLNENVNVELPQGKYYCKELFERKMAVNGQILAIKYISQKTGQNVWSYYPPEKVDYACNDMWIHREADDINNEIILIQERSLNKKNEYSQGKDNCIKLCEE